MQSRRTLISCLGIICLTIIGLVNNDSTVPMAIAAVCGSLSAANAWSSRPKRKDFTDDAE